MSRKIFQGILLVSLVAIFACTALVVGAMYDYLGSKMDAELKNQALAVRAAIESSGEDYFRALEEESGIDTRITLIDSAGKVTFDNRANSSEMSNHLQREEVKEALASGEGYAVRKSDTLSLSTRYYAVKLSDGSVLRLAQTHRTRLALIMDTKGALILIIVAAIALSIVISTGVSRRIMRPVNEIDLDDPDVREGYDEIGPLVGRIRQQNARIRSQMEDLRRQREEFGLIAENMHEGLITIDSEMNVLTCNGSALALLGAGGTAAAEEAAGAGEIATAAEANAVEGREVRAFGNILTLNRSAAFREAVASALKGERARKLLSAGGRTLEIMADPAAKGAVIIIMDVTDREQAEELRREFTSNVSHELKTPLTSIYGISDMLAGDLVKPEDVKQFAVALREEAARLIALTEDVMKLSRLDENRVLQKKEKLDVAAAAEEVASRLAEKAERAGVTLTTYGSGAFIMGVDTILDEIIYNLTDNAIKYNEPGGFVKIEVKKKKDICLLTVEDSGIGIPAKDVPRVFERFYRVDKSHSRETGGTGLGLSIVKHAAAYLDGQIEIESREGKGTKITVAFKAV